MTQTITSQLKLSELAPELVQSEIRAMTMECDRMGGVNLAQGVCDTDVPAVVMEGAIAAMREGHNIYTRADGVARLRRAIAEKVTRTHGIEVDDEREVIVTSGATGGFQAAAMAVLNPGDEVLVFEPYYGYHLTALSLMKMVPVSVPMRAPEWTLDEQAVRAAVTPRTRAMVINSPSNPAGKVFSRAEMEALAEIAREFDLFIFSDEIYEHFLYGGLEHLSPLMLEGMRERTILISGFSKTYSVTGWRLGYVVTHERWRSAMAYFHDLLYVCAPAPLQHGVAAGVEQLPESFYKELSVQHERKRDRLLATLRSIGMDAPTPQGAYYILADAGALPGKLATEKARWLLTKTGVAAVAGSAFMAPGSGRGENLLRFCFAKKDADLADACERLRALKA